MREDRPGAGNQRTQLDREWHDQVYNQEVFPRAREMVLGLGDGSDGLLDSGIKHCEVNEQDACLEEHRSEVDN